jgi:LmbE family N-acetylglucosaminyl deacetylase
VIAKRVLVVVAHADDEVLGCGGTIARHIKEGDSVKVVFYTDGVSSRIKNTATHAESREFASERALTALGVEHVSRFVFPDNELDSVSLLKLVKPLEKVLGSFLPQYVYTHFSHDLNIDHRLVHQAVMTACRPQSWSSVKGIFTFEVPSSTEWNSISGSKFNPNKFVDITEFWPHKSKALLEYSEELRPFPHSRSVEALEALAVWRGATVGFKKAEAFQVERILDL